MTGQVTFRDLAVGAVYKSATNDDFPNAGDYPRVKVSRWRWRFVGERHPTFTAELGAPVIVLGIGDTAGGVR